MNFVKNTLLTAFVVMVFSLIGWVNITHTFSQTETDMLLNAALVSVVIGFFYNGAVRVIRFMYAFVVFVTLGIGFVFYPIYLLGGASLVALYVVIQIIPWINTSGITNVQLWFVLMAMYWIRSDFGADVKANFVRKQDESVPRIVGE